MYKKYLFLFIVVIFFLKSCSVTKNISDNNKLYDKVKITYLDNQGDIRVKLKQYETQLNYKPNKHTINLLGIKVLKFNVMLYNMFYKHNQKKSKKIGRPPVLYNTIKMDRSIEELSNILFKDGYFDNKVEYLVDSSKSKKNSTHIKVNLNKRYSVNKVSFFSDDFVVNEIINNKVTLTPYITSGIFYDEKILEKELNNIETALKNYGYYRFSNQFIYVEADTIGLENKVNIEFKINKDSTSQHIFDRYIIDKVIISDNKKDSLASLEKLPTQEIFYFGKNPFYKIETLAYHIDIRKSKLYSYDDIRRTYSSLYKLNSFNNISITDSISDQKNKLINTTIKLERKKKYGYSFDLEAKRRTQNFGLSGNLSFEIRNIFKSLSKFKIGFDGDIELQFLRNDLEEAITKNNYRYGINAQLIIPKFVLNPFNKELFYRKYNTYSKISSAYNYHSRINYKRLSTQFKYSYRISSKNKNIVHIINPIELDYSNIEINSVLSEMLKSQQNLILKEVYNSNLSTVFRYNYNYQKLIRNRSFFKLFFEIYNSGTLLGLYKFLELNTDQNNRELILGVPYSQFIKSEIEIIKYFILKKSTFAFKFNVGFAKPYGNSNSLRINNSFYISGSRDVRGFLTRTLGPGKNTSQNSNPESVGEIKIVFNSEFRFDISKKIEGAIFTDIGNIWMNSDQENKKNVKFEFKDFYEELGIGSGIGIRYDMKFLVLLLDFSKAIHNAAENKKWSLDRPITLNFGLNYPF